MTHHVLLAYASKRGSTAQIAQEIAVILDDQLDLTVSLKSIDAVESLDNYDAVVLGSAIYGSHFMPEMTVFIMSHMHELTPMPAAMFSVSLRMRDDTPEMRSSVMESFNSERVVLQPVSIGMFGGMLVYDDLDPITCLQAKTRGFPEGDFRDWSMIRAWAAELAPLLIEEIERQPAIG